MDVVPVDEEKWVKSRPWNGDLVDGKRIYGRGTQDMKSVSIQYIEAVKALKSKNYTPKRTVYLLLVPDEEVGGNRGIKPLLTSDVLKRMNPGVVMDEGLASPDGKYSVFYGERKIWWVKVTAVGSAGHGSRFIENTAVPKLLSFANQAYKLRGEEEEYLKQNCGCGKQLGDYTTINLTMMSAGDNKNLQYNVIPTHGELGFDIRIPCTEDLSAFSAKLDSWAKEAGTDVKWEIVGGMADGALSNPTSDITEGSFWWKTLQDAAKVADIEFHAPSVFPAATDSRWIRLLTGIPCFGFSPMNNTPILLHDHDEFIEVDTFLKGIRIYENMIQVLADAEESPAL
jgi:aminoacylase